MNIRSDFQSLPPVTSDVALAAAQKTAANRDAPVSDSASASADQTHLSGAASLAAHAAALPDVREEKVESVRAAIAAGTYNVSSSDVAQSLMRHLLGGRE
ncbi:MAG: flagellar biosynthesis anti-sigma factor FlgM [Acidobacteriaceae bacterium]